MSFSTDDVAVVLTGEEWFAILVKFNDLLTGKNTPNATLFSRSGIKAYTNGRAKLESQILTAAAASPEKPKRNRKKPDAPPNS